MPPDRLRTLLRYDPATGHFEWLVRQGQAKPGKRAGTPVHGRVIIRIDGVNYFAHRLAWLYVHGTWPADQIDHINGEPADNRLFNLRECTHAENHQNTATRRDNRLQLTGVSLHRHSGLFAAEIKAKGKRHLLGYYKTPEAAHTAYLDAKARLHEFQPTPRKPPRPYRGATSPLEPGHERAGANGPEGRGPPREADHERHHSLEH